MVVLKECASQAELGEPGENSMCPPWIKWNEMPRGLLVATCIRLLTWSIEGSLPIIVLYTQYKWRRQIPQVCQAGIIKHDMGEWASTCLLNSSSNPKCSSAAPSEPNNVPVLTDRPGKTCFTASWIVCATQQQETKVALSPCCWWYARVNEGCSQTTAYVLCRCLGMITSVVQVQRAFKLHHRFRED